MEFKELDLKTFVEDKVYYCLKERFLTDEKNASQDLNRDEDESFELTNKLLLQLYFLKEEGGKCLRLVGEWFGCLFPGVSYPQNKIARYAVQVFKNAIGKFNHDELNDFLSLRLDFEKVSDALSSFSLTRKELIAPETWHGPQSPNQVVTNQVVADLIIFKNREGFGESFLFKWLMRLLSMEINPVNQVRVKNGVAKVVNKRQKLMKSKRNKISFDNYMKQSFEISAPKQAETSVPRLAKIKLPCTCAETRWKREARLKEELCQTKTEMSLYKELYEEEVRLKKEVVKDFEGQISKLQKKSNSLSMRLLNLKTEQRKGPSEEVCMLKTDMSLYKQLYEEEVRQNKEMVEDFERQISRLQKEKNSLSASVLDLKTEKRKAQQEETNDLKVPKLVDEIKVEQEME